MANQNKFVSVNLNKSYGRSSSLLLNSYGTGSRPRSVGGSGGPRLPGQKSGPRLSVPPPLNLPSLRKEHEHFDHSGTTARSAGSGTSGLGLGHGSPAIGWTRTSIQAQSFRDNANQSEQSASKNLYSVSAASDASLKETSSSFRTPGLRGEDFPSLSDTCEASKKRRDVANQKPKQVETKDPLGQKLEISYTQPSMQPSRPINGKGHASDLTLVSKETTQKNTSSLPEPLSLPLVHLNRKSDWADDERDTGIGILERDRERGLSRADANQLDDYYAPSREFMRKDSYGREPVASVRDNRDSGSWRGGNDRQNLADNRRSTLQENGNQSSWLNGRNANMQANGRDGDNRVNRNTPTPRSPFSPVAKGYPMNDPVLNFSRERSIFANGTKPSVEDPIFDVKGPSFGGISGDVISKINKKKKDAAKHADFYDPARESFEVELQRVQQSQEMERQKVREEKTRAIELARKEEEERERIARLEEEQRRKIEAEEKEAAWRAEQEMLEASRKAEEQRIAREEEKRRIMLEEERRKEAAREKLLELEARIAKRQAEEAAKDDKNLFISISNQKKDESLSGNNSRNLDSTTVNRIQSSRDGNSFFSNKEKLDDLWRRKEESVSNTLVMPTQEQESSRRAPQIRNFFVNPDRSSLKEEISESRNSREHGWKTTSESGDIDVGFLENDGEVGWRSGRSSDVLHSSYSFQNAGVDGISSSGRSRYSLRQPRVLPPPISSAHRRSFGASNEFPNSSTVSNSDSNFENGYQDQVPEPVIIPSIEKLTITLENGEKTSPGCASQSSLSVTSPPSYRTHDDLEDSGLAFSDVDRPNSGAEDGDTTLKMSPSSISLGADDEWEIENNQLVQDQEEYDEDSGYHDEDGHDGDGQIPTLAVEHKILSDSANKGFEVKPCESGEILAPELNPIPETQESSSNDPNTTTLTSVDNSVDSAPMASISSISTPNQAEVPMKLQFGLFSGPSLIPSPVPAIQIGSIQMPLHLHPPVAQMHSSQSPFFQFGQMGLLPLAPQGMSFVHPPHANHYPLTQSQRIMGEDSSVQISQLSDPQTKNLSDLQENKPVSPDVLRKEECANGEKKNEGAVAAKDQPILVYSKESHSRKHLFSEEKASNNSRFMNSSSGRGKRYVYKVKNSTDSRPLLPAPKDFPKEPHNYQKRFLRDNTQQIAARQKQGEALDFVNRRSAFHSKNGMSKPTKSTTSSREESSKRNLSSLVADSRRNGSLEEDTDPALQSGIIRIFNQPGIEALSDEDDFIEVRSKRQMLNDRREQREKINKEKSRVLKVARKPYPASQNNPNSLSSNRAVPVSAVATDFITRKKSDSSTAQVALLAPIGTPSVTTDADGRSSRRTKISQSSFRGNKLTSGVGFEKKSAIDNMSTSLGPWSDPPIDQQVNMLTMEPSGFEGHADSMSSEPEKSLSTPIKPKEKTYSSSATSLGSVFPGERIQFGAVMSSAILPPISRAISRMSAPEESSLGFMEKEKLNEETLNDTEAEAEAAASAVAVAAISSDEVAGNELSSNSTGSHSQELKGGQMTVNNQSAAEEPLNVALPADLSVETPISLWPPLPSPQNSSGPMISCFPGPAASHFPCYDMNPMMSGPVFAFSGPGDESNIQTQQLQRNGPTHLGPWPISAHSGIDSFYGPFISPPVGPPHMVVYNHFTPVGQFGQLGQLGLGFMGTAYIPSGKQPDWKHSVGTANGDGNSNGDGGEGSAGVVSSGQQRGVSPVLPMASPLTMFDLSPFQPATDMPVPPRWSHLVAPPPPLHSVPLSVPATPPPPYQADHPMRPSQSSTSTQLPIVDQAMNFPSRSTPRLPEEFTLVETPNQASHSRPSTINTQAFQAPPAAPPVPAQHYIQKVGPGGEWYRRQGIHQGKSFPSGSSEKSFSSAKVKQIYVAKPTATSGGSTSS